MSNRLNTIVSLVPKCDVVLDVGTDHAYVPIDLIKKGITKKCIASDLRKGPVEIAKKNIEQNKMCDKIEVRLGSGLQVIEKNQVNCIIIAGMGGALIKELLEEGKDKITKGTILIVQPNIYQDTLREWFYKNGFKIYNEVLVLEDKKLYTIMCVEFTGNVESVDEFKYYIGEHKVKDGMYKLYIENMLRKYKRVLNNLDNMKNEDIKLKERYKWLVDNLENELKNNIKGDDI